MSIKMKLALVELSRLKEHEQIEENYLKELKEQIRADGFLKRPIVVDKNTFVILDGHFRYNCLKELGCCRIPAYLVDYNDPNIVVLSWRKDRVVKKEDVVQAGLTGKKFPPKTSRHMVKASNSLVHISTVGEDVNFPLEKLKRK